MSGLSRAASVGYLCVALFTTVVTTYMAGTRIKTIHASNRLRLKPIHYIALGTYIMGIMFSIAAALIAFGFGLVGPIECYAAVNICIVFYMGHKFGLYLFLVERTQVVRARTLERRRNWIYMFGLFIVIFGFGIVAALSFAFPVHDYDETGCTIGLPSRISLSVLIYDIVMNFFLTFVFLYLVRPYFVGNFKALFNPWIPIATSQEISEEGQVIVPQAVLGRTIRKTFWGCLLIVPTTITNFTLLVAMQGHQRAWMCLMFCTLDVFWGIVIIHWLTTCPDELDSVKARTYGDFNPSRVTSATFAGIQRSVEDIEMDSIRREAKISIVSERNSTAGGSLQASVHK